MAILPGYKFIANPYAGRGKSLLLPRYVKEFGARYGVETDLQFTEKPGQAVGLARAAAEDGWPAVVAVGGDGTVGEVLNGLVGTSTVMGVVPAGTGNDLARTLGIPFAFDRALACLADSEIRAIDIGQETQQYFGMLLGLGLPTDVMLEANRWSKLRFWRHLKGSLNIAAGVIKATLRLQATPMSIFLDDRVVEAKATGVFVMNTRYAGKGLLLAPFARFDDGLFDIIIIGEISRLEVIRFFPRVYTGRHLAHPRVHHYRSSTVQIIPSRPLRKMFDGDVSTSGPVEARVIPRAVRILVPPGRKVVFED